MKKSLVKLAALSSAAFVLVGTVAPVVSAEDSSLPVIAGDEIEDPTDPFGSAAKLEKEQKAAETTEAATIITPEEAAADPYKADVKLDKNAPVNAFEFVGRRFKTLAEAVEAYPNHSVMYDSETGDYVVFTNRGGRKTFVFENVQDALNAFPNLKPLYEDGKYYVYSEQAPRLQYSFATVQEAYETFGEDANPMYDSETGKYVVYTNKLPRFTYEFDSFEDAMAAFPGSFPMAENGKYYVFTTYEKVAGTKGTVKNYVEGKLQDTDKSIEVEGEDKKEVTPEKEAGKASGKAASKGEQLPETGEATSYAIFGAAALAVLSGVGLVAPKFKEEK